MYSVFANYYDLFMNEEEYDQRADYIIGLFSRFGKVPSLMLDAACGTGTMSVKLQQRGVKDVIGVDISEDMLAVANEKAKEQNADILFLNQSLQDLDLYGTVDGAVCTLDSLNHITSKAELLKAFKKISLFMEPGSLFIFDVNTVYKHKNVLGNNTFILENDDVYCVWQNFYNSRNNTVDIGLDFFVSDGEKYERYNEFFTEKAYTDKEISELVKKSGFEKTAVFSDLKTTKPSSRCERKVYVVRKK